MLARRRLHPEPVHSLPKSDTWARHKQSVRTVAAGRSRPPPGRRGGSRRQHWRDGWHGATCQTVGEWWVDGASRLRWQEVSQSPVIIVATRQAGGGRDVIAAGPRGKANPPSSACQRALRSMPASVGRTQKAGQRLAASCGVGGCDGSSGRRKLTRVAPVAATALAPTAPRRLPTPIG
jgi:hypothetical protein